MTNELPSVGTEDASKMAGILEIGDLPLNESDMAADMLRSLAAERDELASRVRELTELSERLKLEAQIHAQEARTANATIAEIYQCVTGATGEPGTWNGAEPVRQRLAELEGALKVIRNHSSVSLHQIEMIDAALASKEQP